MASRLLRQKPPAVAASSSSPPMEFSSCGSLLHELQDLWDEVGESDHDRDKMILQLEQECLDVYRRKVDHYRKHKADLCRGLAEGEAEISNLISVLGDYEPFLRLEKTRGTLKEQIDAMKPTLENLTQKKKDRVKEFFSVQVQVDEICAEIAGNTSQDGARPQVDDNDLGLKRLAELKSQLQELQKHKDSRMQKVNGYIKVMHELSCVLAVDFRKIISEIHPSFGDSSNSQAKSISDDTLARLASTLNSLKKEKQERLEKLQNVGTTLIELWSLLDTPLDEQKRFSHITCFISASAETVSGRESLALDVIKQVDLEVERLNGLKASKMKELILRKQSELEEICVSVHMEIDGGATRHMLFSLINSGGADLSGLLSSLDNQIAAAKEQAISRKDILDKMEKLTHASDEESWLDDYERDQNRYNAGRGAHINLKRAEKARILASKIPSLLENLTTKVRAWEGEKGMSFLYDKVRILESLEQFTALRQQREEEKRRSREQKKVQDQFAAEQEALFGWSSKRSPMGKKPLGQSAAANANTVTGTPTSRRVSTPYGRHGKMPAVKAAATIPVNYVALSKDD